MRRLLGHATLRPIMAMNFSRALASVVVLGFAGVCAFVLLGRRSNDSAPAGPTPSGAPQAAASDSALELTLLNSVAKQAFIDKVVADFNQRQERVGDKIIRVKASHGASNAQWNEVKEGRSKPDLWSPGDQSWIRIANDGWTGLNNRRLFEDGDVKPTVNVPLCIAMWEPMAVALGYPKPLGWEDLAKLSAEPTGWKVHGHPEWGSFKWGHAHPDANSGFLTVLAAVYAITNKTKNLTLEDLRAPSLLKALSTLEHSVEHYGLTNVWIDNFMREKGPAYLSATIQYENAIIEGNRKTQNKPFKIVAIYPKEGTFITQHPMAIPQAEWMTEQRRSAARKFVDYVLSSEAQTAAIQLGLRPLNPMPLGYPFTSEFGVSPELPAIAQYEVPNEGILKRVIDLWQAAKKPASIMMLLDTSGSMAGEALDKAKEGAVSFIERMQPRDELEIRTFSHVITQLQPAAPVSTCGEAARQNVRGLFASGGTHLYDVLREGVISWSERKKQHPERHYGVVLLTDGNDEGSTSTLPDLMDVLPKGDNPETIKIFTIGYGPKTQSSLLKEIANKSNARAYQGTTSNIAAIYQEISSNF